MAVAKNNKDDANELVELAVSLGASWPVVLVCCLVFFVGGCIYAEWVRPVYEVDALLQVETKSKGAGALAGDIGSLFSTGSPTETEIELVKSRRVIGAVVDALGLRNYVVPKGYLDRLLHAEGRLEFSTLEIPKNLIEEPMDRYKPWIAKVIDETHYSFVDCYGKLVIESCEVEKECEAAYTTSLGTDTVKVGAKKMKAKVGQEFKVFKLFRLEAIQNFEGAFSVSEKGKRTGILEFSYQDVYPDRAAYIVNEVASAYQRQNIDQRSVEAKSTIEFLESQLPLVRGKLDSAEQSLNVYRSQVGSADITTETKIVLESQKSLQKDILEMEQRRQETVRLFHEDHPQVKTLDDQIKRLKAELSKTSGQVKKMPEKQQEVLRLTSEVELNKLLYTNMLNNIQQLKLVAAGEVGSVRIVDVAEPTLKPIKPKKNVIRVFGLFIGFCISVVFVSIKKRFHSGIKDARTIERELGISVFAKIPKGTAQQGIKGTLPLALAAPDDVAVEAIRTLRTSLEFMMPEDAPSVISISGLIPGVGKSFVSVNLATLFASTGKRVVLIDADLRKGRLHKEFGYHRDNGLAEVLMNRVAIEDALKPTSVENLTLLVCGKVPSSPAELLGSQRYAKLMDTLKSQYDVVIVDTPPVMLVTDAMYACRYSDQAIMVVEYDRHSIDAIREALELFTKGAPETLHQSIVINKYVHRNDGYGYKYGKY